MTVSPTPQGYVAVDIVLSSFVRRVEEVVVRTAHRASDFYLGHPKEGTLMEHAPADPRDGHWEIDRPVYRVYFWRPDGGACREYELLDAADVGEVLDWAKTFPQTEPGLNDWVPEVAVTHRDRVEGFGLIRLMGGRPGQTGSSATIRF